jgi:hypothetical protein
MKKIIYTLLLLASASVHAQVKVGDNPTTIDPNAVLEMESNAKGMLLPRMTAVERDAISNPTNSMLIYNTTESCINIYNLKETKWKSICGEDAAGTAEFTTDCSKLAVSGTYTTGIQLDGDVNYITITVDVTELGSYTIVTRSGAGMYFAATGEFTTLGEQEIVLEGQGYPLVAGANFLALDINGTTCTTVINVANGLAVVSSCGSGGSLTGSIIANQAITSGDVYQSYTTGPAYTGGGVYGITSTAVNGIRISQPVNGVFSASGAPIDYIITGTALTPGSTTLSYSINGFACSFTVPVTSGAGRASAVTCGGALSGTYQVGTAATGANTKVVTLTVSTIGDFYIRTNTVNGIYFTGSATAAATGALNVTLTANGTPIAAGTDTYTVTVSSSATAFVTCTFTVTTTLPATIPDFKTISCATLGPALSYIKANNTDASDYFGGYFYQTGYLFGKCTKISADGLTLAVGAYGEDGDLTGGNINSTNNNNWNAAGAAYIYTRTSLTANWTFQAKLKPTQLGAGDVFGNSVDLSDDGNTLVVGSMREDGSGTGVNPVANNSATEAGAAYVFVRSGSTWSQQAYLKATDVTAGDQFGGNVAISGDGNTVAVGAIGEDGSGTGINPVVNNSATSAGAVYTYTRSGSVWSADAYIKASNTGGNDWFGADVALNYDGTTLAVVAELEDGSGTGVNPLSNNSATDAGAVYVFAKSGIWSQQAYLKAKQTSAGDQAVSVDLDGSGNTLVAGYRLEDGNGKGINPGANESAANAGAAFIYTRTGSTWDPTVTYLKASNTGANDQFGISVTISKDGNSVLVGAWAEDGSNGCINSADNNLLADAGAAYLFNLFGGNWISSFKFKMSNVGITAYDYFGGCVSISGDGRSVAMNGQREDGSGVGVNPTPNNSANDAGCVITFTK